MKKVALTVAVLALALPRATSRKPPTTPPTPTSRMRPSPTRTLRTPKLRRTPTTPQRRSNATNAADAERCDEQRSVSFALLRSEQQGPPAIGRPFFVLAVYPDRVKIQV
jgi:hypothetical protein